MINTFIPFTDYTAESIYIKGDYNFYSYKFSGNHIILDIYVFNVIFIIFTT